jgi:GAF domain-containing protein/HAMP domain-containing protein
MLILLVYCVTLIRQNRVSLAMTLIIGSILVIIPEIAALISGLGVILGIALVLIVPLIAGQTLTSRSVTRALIIGIVLAILTVSIDLFAPWERVSYPLLQNVIPYIVVAALLVLGIYLFRQLSNFSLRTKLVSAFLLVTLIPMAIISYLNYRSTTQALVQAANVKIAGAAQITADEVDSFFTNTLNATRVKAQDPVIIDYLLLPVSQRSGSAEEAQVNKLLNSYSHEDSLFVNSIGVIDVNGKSLVDTSPAEIGVDKTDRDYFQQAVKTGLPYSSELIFSEVTEKPSLYFTAPVRNPADGSIIGVFRIRYDAAILQTIVAKLAGLAGEASLPVLLDENHIRLAHGLIPDLDYKTIVPLSADALAKLQANHSLPSGTAEQLSTNLPEFEAGLNNVDKQPFFIAELHEEGEGTEETTAVKLKSHPWIAVFGQTNTVFLTPIQTQTRNSLLAAVILALLAAGLGFVVAQALSGPVVRLTAVANQIAAGDIQVQAKVESGDEVGTLASTFNTMTAQLRELIGSLEQRVADRTKALATSAEVSRSLSTILDQKQLVTEVVEQVQKSFNYYHAHIYLLNEAGDELVLAGGTGDAGQTLLARGHKILKGQGLVGRAAETNVPVLVSDTSKSSDWLPNPLLPETKSEVAIPISIGDQALGVLDVQHNIANGLQQEDANLLLSIANQVAVALQNIRQYANTQKIAADMGVVANVGIATSTITDVTLLLQEVVDLSKKSFKLYHAHIYLLNETGDALELTSGAGEVGRQMVSEKRSIPLDSEQSLVARAARTREGVVVNDVTAAPDFLPNPLLPDTRAEMAVPMLVAGKVIGVLDVQSEIANRFTDVDVSIQSTLASQVAVALQNARSFSQAQRQAERETAVNLITQKIQSATTIEAALQVTARELGRALGMKPTLVTLEPESSNGERKSDS